MSGKEEEACGVITKELIESVLEDLKKSSELHKGGGLPYMNQIRPGLWEISSGGEKPCIMWTGDGGAEEMRKAMREAAIKYKSDG